VASDDTITPRAHPPEDQRDKFIGAVSSRYPLFEELITRFGDRWEWEGRWSLSDNEALPWSEELIARFENQWDWSRLPSECLRQYTPDDIRQIMSGRAADVIEQQA
jgi:hypothetical protein